MRAKSKPKRSRRQSKSAYLAKRLQKVRELYRFEGLRAVDIASRLVADGTIETLDESLESAIRLVRSDIAKIRVEVDEGRIADSHPAVATTELDALERELAELKKQHARQEMIAAGEPMELCGQAAVPLPPSVCAHPACVQTGKHRIFVGPAVGVTQVDTPQGPMTSYRALWPAGVRQKAGKDAAILAEKISKLEVALTEKRRALADSATKQRSKKSGDGTEQDDVYRIVASGKDFSELVLENAERPN